MYREEKDEEEEEEQPELRKDKLYFNSLGGIAPLSVLGTSPS